MTPKSLNAKIFSLLWLLLSSKILTANLVFNEIYFHHPPAPRQAEDVTKEWIELYNPGALAVDLSGWRITGGIDVMLPAVTIPAGGYLVLGPQGPDQPHLWAQTQQLSNKSERLRLINQFGQQVDQVTYADEGEWATRVLGALDYGYRGWEWEAPADGGGYSLERRNSPIREDTGQLWNPSAVIGGTPGAVNSNTTAAVAPLILDPEHLPLVPRSTDTITFRAKLVGNITSATVFWRANASQATTSFFSLPMHDADGDGRWEATLPPRDDLTIIDYYFQASDGANTRTWPAFSRTSVPESATPTFAPQNNALLQVDNSFDEKASCRPGATPIYRLIMTPYDKDTLQKIQTQSFNLSDAAYNATVITLDGLDLKLRPLCSVRNRGYSTRIGPPNNYNVSFTSDNGWYDLHSFQLNCQYTPNQALASILWAKIGIQEQTAVPVIVMLNGRDMSRSGTTPAASWENLLYGRFVRVEPHNQAWVNHHFPTDNAGNLYRADDHLPGSINVPPGNLGSGEFRYEGNNPDAYRDTFLKNNNEEVDDYTDLIRLCRVISAPATGGNSNQPAISDSAYVAALTEIINIDQWLTFFAFDALIGNQEGGLQSGRADDFGLYRGTRDPRFVLLPHDMDAIFGIGSFSGYPVTRSIFSYEGVLGLQRFFNHPEIEKAYYRKILSLMDTFFNRATLDPIIDQLMTGWVPASQITAYKNFIDKRRNNILTQINRSNNLTINLERGASGYPEINANLSSVPISLQFDVLDVNSIAVNGQSIGPLRRHIYNSPSSMSIGQQNYALDLSLFQPGLNRINAIFYSGENLTGRVIESKIVEIFYRTDTLTQLIQPTLSGSLRAEPPGTSLSIKAPATFLPGVPFVIEVQRLTGTGEIDRYSADQTVVLTASHGQILTPNQITLQHGRGSALVTIGTFGSTNEPISFTIYATAGFLSAGQIVKNGTKLPAESYGLNDGSTYDLTSTELIWSGVINLISSVRVPPGETLTINPGTLILVKGTTAEGSSNAPSIIVNGTLLAQGTATEPIHFTCSEPAARWGELLLNPSANATLRHTFISRAAHSVGRGHTGRGPVVRLSGANLTLTHSVISDSPGKAIYTSGSCDVVLEHSLITRCVTGPELLSGASLRCEDTHITHILPDYRESTHPVPDDEDALYVQNTANRPVNIRRCVFYRCGDDIIDGLGGLLTIEDSILRDGWDKGVSLLNNDLTLRRTLIVNCDKAVVPKSSTAATRTITIDQCTIDCEDHNTSLPPWGYTVPPDDPDPDTPSTALYTQNKSGQSNGSAILAITATNCVLSAKEPIKVEAPYSAANTLVTYSTIYDTDTTPGLGWPGVGNLTSDPLYLNPAIGLYALRDASPARNAGDPARMDADGSRLDQGGWLAPSFTPPTASVFTLRKNQSPYLIINNVTVPAGSTLQIEAGTAVHFFPNQSLTCFGTLKVLGTAEERVLFTSYPLLAVTDSDPLIAGNQSGLAKWSGVRLRNSLHAENVIRYADFVNAQGVNTGTDNLGSLGIIDSQALVEYCTFSGTRLRMLYGSNCTLTVRHCLFPDMFTATDNPVTLGLDNVAEQLKIVGTIPTGGHLRVYHNLFYGNKGHNDVMDCDSGRWPNPVLDCRYNYFYGLTGDEHIDLGGDAYIAGNVFERGTKDAFTSDRGYSNAISTGDLGPNTTVMVARNLFFDVDHAINLKAQTGTIFEHNTCANFKADYFYNANSIQQNVKCGAINLFVPEDIAPTAGDGAYVAYNIFSNLPRVFTNADLPNNSARISKLEVFYNFIDPLMPDITLGPRHSGTLFSPEWGTGNLRGQAHFISPAEKNYNLMPSSAARQSARGLNTFNYGHTIDEWTYLLGAPRPTENPTNATVTVGGPGIVAYQWRLNGGDWSAPQLIGAGGVFPRTGPTIRTATITLSNLPPAGAKLLEVRGQDFAGIWQPEPTRAHWNTNASPSLSDFHPVIINEIAFTADQKLDYIELKNLGSQAISDPSGHEIDVCYLGQTITLPLTSPIPAGGVAVISAANAPSSIPVIQGNIRFYVDYPDSLPKDAVSLAQTFPLITVGRSGPPTVVMGPSSPHLQDNWTLIHPSRGTENEPLPTAGAYALRIGEWFARPDVRGDQPWFELWNSDALPVSLAGVSWSHRADKPMSSRSFPRLMAFPRCEVNSVATTLLPHLFYLASGERFAIDADLHPQQDRISLYDADGREIDAVQYGPQHADLSSERTASGQIITRELPTRGFAFDEVRDANALAILRSLRVASLLSAPQLIGTDYLELKNTGTISLDLTGASFTRGLRFTFGSFILPPGQSVILTGNPLAFRATYRPHASLSIFAYNGRLDDRGETVELTLPAPYHLSVFSFAYEPQWSPFGRAFAATAFDLKPAWLSRSSSWVSTPLGGRPAGLIPTSPSAYLRWLIQHDVPEAVDVDQDALANIFEYATGLSPVIQSNADWMPRDLNPRTVFITPTDPAYGVSFYLPTDATVPGGHGRSEVQYSLQVSDDLIHWQTVASKSPINSHWTGPISIDSPTNDLVRITLAPSFLSTEKKQRYWRLKTEWVR